MQIFFVTYKLRVSWTVAITGIIDFLVSGTVSIGLPDGSVLAHNPKVSRSH